MHKERAGGGIQMLHMAKSQHNSLCKCLLIEEHAISKEITNNVGGVVHGRSHPMLDVFLCIVELILLVN